MNCANHLQNTATAYCRTCGKPLCAACSRPVMGVIYCENCLAEKVSGTVPSPSPYQTSPQQTFAGQAASVPAANRGPNPALAGILGAIPFGVGAIYCGQYTKGLVHLGIFVAMVVALSSDIPAYWYIILGIGMGFFVVYQILDAVHTARALQSGRPAPDPFGLTAAFSSGEPRDFSSSGIRDFTGSVPTGAVVLIGLGILFLLRNLGMTFLRADILVPLVLIGLGVWLLARRLGAPGGLAACGARGLMGPVILMTLGVQFLLDHLGLISFGRTLPVLLIVIGVVLAIQRSSAHHRDIYEPPPPTPVSGGIEPPNAPTSEVPPSTEVKNG